MILKHRLLKSVFSDGEVTMRAKTHLIIDVYEMGDEYLAENQDFNILTYSHDVKDTLERFSFQVVHYYRLYKNTPDSQLLQYSREMKQLYLSSFEEM